MRKFIRILFVFLALAITLVACVKKTDKTSEIKEDGKIKVYASVYPVYDFTKKIGGDKIDLSLVIPNGQEPHDWEPGQNDMKNLEKADILVYNGAGLESWTEKVIDSLENKDLILVEASEGVKLIKGHHHHHDHNHEVAEGNHNSDHDHEVAEGEHDHNHEGIDPHIWLSPKNAIVSLNNIAAALIKADPSNENFYKQNLDKYTKEIENLNKLYTEKLSNLSKNTIVVSHKAYGYLCHEYGLKQVGIMGINAESEPDAKTMAMIIDLVKDEGITTIFTEELIDPKIADTIASETGAKTIVLSPLEALSQEEIDSNEDYISIMKTNLDKIVEALK